MALLAATVASAPARAPHPVCPPPSQHRLAFKVCPKGGGLGAMLLLSTLSIDHVFKPPRPPYRHAVSDIVRRLAAPALIADEAFADFLEGLGNIEFTKLDLTTGTFAIQVSEEWRAFRWEGAVGAGQFRLAVRLPSQLAGGYWRTPGALELRFWKDERVWIDTILPGGLALSATVGCVSIAPEGVRIVPVDPQSAQILLSFAGCR